MPFCCCNSQATPHHNSPNPRCHIPQHHNQKPHNIQQHYTSVTPPTQPPHHTLRMPSTNTLYPYHRGFAPTVGKARPFLTMAPFEVTKALSRDIIARRCRTHPNSFDALIGQPQQHDLVRFTFQSGWMFKRVNRAPCTRTCADTRMTCCDF
jgi:hypothetical protein